jgi:CubicO group peptidase (beta-lactamase class C family)
MRVRFLVFVLLLAGPAGLAASPVCAAESGSAAIWPTKDWQVSTPEQQGMDSARLAQLIETVGVSRQDSLLIVRHGHIVAEAYYAPYGPGIVHDLRSVTKSVTGTLIAIALQKKIVDAVDHSVVSLFDAPIANLDDKKKAITLQHLLDMTSGIAWQEKNYTPDETIMRMYASPDHTRFVLDQPMADALGARFYYNSGNPYVLSALITKTTGRNAFDFAKKELFGPLGIAGARWNRVDAQGVSDGEAGLYLTPRDMAKLGYLYLNNGRWEDTQLIPAAWVERARQGPVPATFGLHYGNLWWSLPEKDAYMALGRHSQMILVLPKLDIVAAMTGAMLDDEHYPLSRLIDDIAGAVKSDGPLPPDPIANALLAAAVRGAARDKPAAVGGTPEELAKSVSGRVYRFADNPLHIKTFVLNFLGADSSWEVTTRDAKPASPVRRFSGLMGLDGHYRKSPPAFYGINAARGRWLNERTFELDRRVLGHGETQTWTLTFDGEKVTVVYRSTDGDRTELHGVSGD